jgi:hypothetical protein
MLSMLIRLLQIALIESGRRICHQLNYDDRNIRFKIPSIPKILIHCNRKPPLVTSSFIMLLHHFRLRMFKSSIIPMPIFHGSDIG